MNPILIVEPEPPTFSGDFVTPYADIVKATSSPAGGIVFRQGVLHVTTVPSHRMMVLHEWGHMLTLSSNRWYRWNSPPSDVRPNFLFKDPRTFNGAMRLCHHELAAMAVENVLARRYGGYGVDAIARDIDKCINNIILNVSERYGKSSWKFDPAELRRIYYSYVLSEMDILVRWDRVITRIRTSRKLLAMNFASRIERLTKLQQQRVHYSDENP
jgi:hypothetical protein